MRTGVPELPGGPPSRPAYEWVWWKTLSAGGQGRSARQLTQIVGSSGFRCGTQGNCRVGRVNRVHRPGFNIHFGGTRFTRPTQLL